MQKRTVTEEERETINDYLSLDEDLLYSLIPPFLPEYRSTAFMTEGQIAVGKEEFEKRTPVFSQKLCGEWKLCEKIKDPMFEDTVQLITTIGDVLAVYTAGIPPFLVASILLKIGLRRFCKCQEAVQGS